MCSRFYVDTEWRDIRLTTSQHQNTSYKLCPSNGIGPPNHILSQSKLVCQSPFMSDSIWFQFHPSNWVKKPSWQGVMVCARLHFIPQFHTGPTAHPCLFNVIASQSTQSPRKHVPKWCFQNQVGSYEILRYQSDLRPLNTFLFVKWPTDCIWYLIDFEFEIHVISISINTNFNIILLPLIMIYTWWLW